MGPRGRALSVHSMVELICEDLLLEWAGPVVLVCGEHDIRPERSRYLAKWLRSGSFHQVGDRWPLPPA